MLDEDDMIYNEIFEDVGLFMVILIFLFVILGIFGWVYLD